MSLFKKKKETVGKGTDETVTLHKEFEVLNYTPLDYMYTTKYLDFLDTAENKFRKMIEKISLDDLCDNMFDSYIDSVIQQMKGSAKEQYAYHMQVIDHHRGMLEGELVCASGHLRNLQQDLKELEEEIDIYEKIKKEKHIL